MRKIRRILVAIKNAEAKSLPAVDKAAQLARALGAQLELFHGIAERLSADAVFYQKGGLVGAERTLHARYQEQLERVAGRLRESGLRVNVTTRWDFPVYEAIVRHARRVKADLIVAECHAGRRIAPWLLHLTDWELLRTSPVPVLLVKNAKAYDRPVVLAALDPAHAFAKPAGLDEVILDTADALTKALRGSLHAMHAYLPVPLVGGPLNGGGAIVALEALPDLEAQARRSFQRPLGRKVPPARRHLVRDVAVAAIPQVVRKTSASIVVMGAISRSGFKRILIGNTAERVLDDLPCDVLVVKPARFVTRVARAGRGLRITATSPFPLPY